MSLLTLLALAARSPANPNERAEVYRCLYDLKFVASMRHLPIDATAVTVDALRRALGTDVLEDFNAEVLSAMNVDLCSSPPCVGALDDVTCVALRDAAVQFVRSDHQDLFEQLPRRYLENHTASCWRDARGRFACLPSLFIAGPMKTGSTWWYQELVKRAGWSTAQPLLANDARTTKEPYFWNEQSRHSCYRDSRMGQFCKLQNYTDVWAGNAASRIRAHPSLGLMDGTALVFSGGPASSRRLPTLPQLLREATPGARIIITVRPPEDRAKSGFFYLTKFMHGETLKDALAGKYSDSMYLQRIRANLLHMGSCLNRTGAICAYYNENALRELHSCRGEGCIGRFASSNDGWTSLIGDGMYWVFLSRWLRSFPPERLLVVGDTSEDLPSDIQQQQCVLHFSFGTAAPALDARASVSKVGANGNANANAHVTSPLRLQAHKEMSQFFQSHNARLWRTVAEFGVPRCSPTTPGERPVE